MRKRKTISVFIQYEMSLQVFEETCRVMQKDPKEWFEKLNGKTYKPPIPDYSLQPAFMDLMGETRNKLSDIEVSDESKRKNN